MYKQTKIFIIMSIIKAIAVIVMLTTLCSFLLNKSSDINKYVLQKFEDLQYIKRYPGE